MADGIKGVAHGVYSAPKLTTYGDFATLTASGSGTSSEVFPDPAGQNMMRRA